MKLTTLFLSCLLLNILLGGITMQAKADTIDNYQIYLRDEIVIKESLYHNPHMGSKTPLILDKTHIDDVIKVNYNHCVAGAPGRFLIFKSAEGAMLFAMKFADTPDPVSISVRELLSNDKVNAKAVTGIGMYYKDDYTAQEVYLTSIRIKDLSLLSSVKAKKDAYWFWAIGLIIAATIVLPKIFLRKRKQAVT